MSDGMVTVVSTFKGSPAELAGIEPGDIIIEVDGVSTEGQNLDEVVAQMKGPEGTTVTLSVYRPPLSTTTPPRWPSRGRARSRTPTKRRVGPSGLPPGGETTEYTLTRATIATAGERQRAARCRWQEGGAHQLLHLLRSDSAAELREEVTEAIEEDDVDAIILDLREQPRRYR